MSNNHKQLAMSVQLSNHIPSVRPALPLHTHTLCAGNETFCIPIQDLNSLAGLLQQDTLAGASFEDEEVDHKSRKVLLGFNNLGHFFDWLDATQDGITHS